MEVKVGSLIDYFGGEEVGGFKNIIIGGVVVGIYNQKLKILNNDGLIEEVSEEEVLMAWDEFLIFNF